MSNIWAIVSVNIVDDKIGEKDLRHILAFDFGASSGRSVLGMFDGETITLKEIKRFANDPVHVNNTLYWDVLRLFYELKESIVIVKQTYGHIDSIGIDTWGVDFGLIDSYGELITNPVHYRDKRTQGQVTQALTKLSKQELYQATGNQIMELNTAFQLLALKKKQPHLIEQTASILLMPDLFNYFLTGVMLTDETIASTTQLFDPIQKIWAKPLMDKLKLPNLFCKLVKSGTLIGQTTTAINTELAIDPTDVIAVCSHDTQSAQVAVPSLEKDFVFLSCGTWSVLGTELDAPILNAKASTYNITNEAAYGNRVSFIKNITGLFILNECKKQWDREGQSFSFEELSKQASLYPCDSLIDPDDPMFSHIGNMPKKIANYCIKTNQSVPEAVGEYVNCIYKSLSVAYHNALREIEDCTGKQYETLYVVGGGSKSAVFCQIIANNINRKVVSGPSEATVLGNMLVQLISKGNIKDLHTARQLVRASENIQTYYPLGN